MGVRWQSEAAAVVLPLPEAAGIHYVRGVLKPAKDVRVVLVTAPSLDSARTLARRALESRLAACANLLAGIESHYWWKGKLEQSGEALILFKTTRSKLARLEELIRRRHPYETPEFLCAPLAEGSESYLKWLREGAAPSRAAGAARAKTKRRPA